jgi:hypothetical protein
MEKTIRASALPKLMACPNSVLNPAGLLVIETPGPQAALGTALHEVAKSLLETGKADLEPYRLQMPPADFDRMGFLTHQLYGVIRQVKEEMPGATCELPFCVEMLNFTLEGHIDVVAFYPDKTLIVDYKFGRVVGGYYHQMAAYAYGMWANCGEPADYQVHVSVVYLDSGEIEEYAFTGESLRAWGRKVEEVVAKGGYIAGKACGTCRIQDTCPAYAVFATNAIAAITKAGPHVPWRDLPVVDRAGLADALDVISKASVRVKDALKAAVIAGGGVLDLGSDNYIMVSKANRTIIPEKAWTVIQTWLGASAISYAKFGLTDLSDAVAEAAPKGKKGEWRLRFAADLESAGAFSVGTTEECWRKPKSETQDA